MAGWGEMEREGSHRRESEDVIVLSPGPQVRRRPPPPPPPPAKAVEVAPSAVYEPPEKLFYKTRLCETFVSSGRCMYEDGCTFAHGSEELRPSLTACAGGWRRASSAPPPQMPPPPPPLPPPAAALAEHDLLARGSVGGGGGGYRSITKVCFEFRDKGTCHFGETCAFPHVSAAEIRQGSRLSVSSEQPARRSVAVTVPRTFDPVPTVAPPSRGNKNIGYGASSMAAAASDHPVDHPPPDQEGRKLTRLEILSRKKMTGIYGDWLDGFVHP